MSNAYYGPRGYPGDEKPGWLWRTIARLWRHWRKDKETR